MCMPISGETWTQHTVWLYVRLMRDILLVSLFRFFSTWCLQGKFFDKHVQANALNMDENWSQRKSIEFYIIYFFPTKRNRCSSYSGTIKYDTFEFQLWSKEGSLEDSSPPHGLWGYLKVQSDGFTSQRHLDKNGQHGG